MQSRKIAFDPSRHHPPSFFVDQSGIADFWLGYRLKVTNTWEEWAKTALWQAEQKLADARLWPTMENPEWPLANAKVRMRSWLWSQRRRRKFFPKKMTLNARYLKDWRVRKAITQKRFSLKEAWYFWEKMPITKKTSRKELKIWHDKKNWARNHRSQVSYPLRSRMFASEWLSEF